MLAVCKGGKEKKKRSKNMIKRFRIVFVLGMLLATLCTFGWASVASAHATTTAPAQVMVPAVPCYNQAFPFGPINLAANTVYEWPGKAPWFQQNSSCLDININFSKLTHSMQMQVCFISTQKCNSWKTVSRTGTWYQIATNVLPGTNFRFGIKTTSATTMQGKIAD